MPLNLAGRAHVCRFRAGREAGWRKPKKSRYMQAVKRLSRDDHIVYLLPTPHLYNISQGSLSESSDRD